MLIKTLKINKTQKWITITNPTAGELNSIIKEYPLFENIYAEIDNSFNEKKISIKKSNPKIEIYDDYVFFTLYDINDKDKNWSNEQIGFIFNDKVLITIQSVETESICNTHYDFYEQAYDKQVQTIEDILIYIIGENLFQKEFCLDKIEENISKIEKEILSFNENIPFYFLMIRQRLEKLWLFFGHEKNVLKTLKSSKYISPENTIQLELLYEKSLKLCEIISFHEKVIVDNINMMSAIFDNRLNKSMELLTLLSIFSMPMMIIGSFFGQNVKGIPFADNEYGFLIVIGFSILISIILMVILKLFKKIKLKK